MEKKYINKWTGNTYTVKKFEGHDVTLVRDNDGYTFTIAVSELYFSYRELQ